ncbi:MAG: PqqD family protein [Clostridia bacterium]|nr:PqqD family protein [Clostridia bacterium]
MEKLRIRTGYQLRTVAGRTVVVPTEDTLDTNVMIVLNETGKLLWDRLSAGATPEELVSALLAEYDVSQDVARSDVQAFIARMRQRGLFED